MGNETSCMGLSSPQTIQLRYLQTLTEIAGDKSSTIVFPLCFNKKDLMKRFKVKCFSWAMIQFSHYLFSSIGEVQKQATLVGCGLIITIGQIWQLVELRLNKNWR